MKNGTHMSWMPSVSSRGRTRTYDPRVMSPMSCQLLYPASNAFVNIYAFIDSVNTPGPAVLQTARMGMDCIAFYILFLSTTVCVDARMTT